MTNEDMTVWVAGRFLIIFWVLSEYLVITGVADQCFTII